MTWVRGFARAREQERHGAEQDGDRHGESGQGRPNVALGHQRAENREAEAGAEEVREPLEPGGPAALLPWHEVRHQRLLWCLCRAERDAQDQEGQADRERLVGDRDGSEGRDHHRHPDAQEGLAADRWSETIGQIADEWLGKHPRQQPDERDHPQRACRPLRPVRAEANRQDQRCHAVGDRAEGDPQEARADQDPGAGRHEAISAKASSAAIESSTPPSWWDLGPAKRLTAEPATKPVRHSNAAVVPAIGIVGSGG